MPERFKRIDRLAYAAGRFIERLSYAAAPSSHRLPASLFRGAPLAEVVELRARWARSHRMRRVRQDRKRWYGAAYGPTLPVPSRQRHRWDAWGGT